MKKFLVALCFGVALSLTAQDYSVPAASPRKKIEQQFSISKVTLDYGRPAVKGRVVFGDLVPYGKVWRAGANSSSKITFGQAVTFGGKDVAAGTYGLYIVPQANEWKIILNKDSQSWGAFSFDEKLNVVDVTVPVQKLTAKQEWFTMDLKIVSDNQLSLDIEWDASKVSVPIQVAKADKVTRMIEKINEVKKIEREK